MNMASLFSIAERGLGFSVGYCQGYRPLDNTPHNEVHGFQGFCFLVWKFVHLVQALTKQVWSLGVSVWVARVTWGII